MIKEVEEKAILIEGWAREGLSQQQIADNLGIGLSTGGNVQAMIFWLKNRKPSQWKDKKEPLEIELMRKELDLRERKLRLEEEKLKDLKDKIFNINVNIVE